MQVSDFETVFPFLLAYLRNKTGTFKAGSFANYSHIWRELTSDPENLTTFNGQTIAFDTLPMQVKPLMQTKLSDIQATYVDLQIFQLQKKGVIQIYEHEAT